MSKNLQEEFPELSQSTLQDVLQTYKNNSTKAAEVLRGIAEEEKISRDQKINELKEQFDLPVDVIAEILQENDFDVEKALVPLFNKISEDSKNQEKEDRNRAEIETELNHLMEIFKSIPQETIQEILDENEGDIDETINQLTEIVSQQEAEKKKLRNKQRSKEAERLRKEQEESIYKLKVEALEEKFPELQKTVILQELEASSGDIKEACKKLMIVLADKKKSQLMSLYKSFLEEEIHDVLERNDWDSCYAAKELQQLREQRKNQVNEEPTQKPVTVTKVQQSLLDKSVIIGNEVEAEINRDQEKKKQREEEALSEFKKELSNIITVQAHSGAMPGVLPPPTPKQIDKLLGKKKPVDDDEEELQSSQTKEAPVIEEKNSSPKGLQVSIKPLQSVVDCGNPVIVEWEILNGESTSYDWIGIFPVDQPNRKYYTYEWRGKQEKRGSTTFYGPSTFGFYDFRYFPSNTYEHVAISSRIYVGPQIEMKASLLEEDKKIKVEWNKKSGNYYRRCWIGLYEKSEKNNKNYINWEYASSNEILFDAPVKPTHYEFRFFAYRYYDVSTSNSIRIEGEDKITAEFDNGMIKVDLHVVSVDPYYDSAWLGVYFVDQPDNRQWRRYKYFSERFNSVSFKAPATPGTYHVRLFANRSYDHVLQSNQFVIPEKKN